jgi:hypothetical protein
LTQARADATAKQGEAQQVLKRERDNAFDEVVALKATVEELTQAREHAEARTVELSQRLSKVRQAKAKEIARSMGATLSLLVIAAAVATVGFWTYQLIWSAPRPVPAVTSDSTPEAEQQRLAAIEEAQHQAKAAGDAEAKLKAAEVEQQRLREEVQRQTKAATDADAKRRAAEAEQQRLAAVPSQSTPAATNTLFEIRRDTEAFSSSAAPTDFSGFVSSLDACEEKCRQSAKRNTFAFRKSSKACFLYSRADFRPDKSFDSGVRK